MGPGGALTGEDPRDDLVGEVGGDEDSGQTDADLDHPEARPKHQPQNPARGKGEASALGSAPAAIGDPETCQYGIRCLPFRIWGSPQPSPQFGHTAYQYFSVFDCLLPDAMESRAVTIT